MTKRVKSVMKNSNFDEFPFVGRLQRHALTKSHFELTNLLSPIGKGKVKLESSIETGIEEKTLGSYFAAVTVIVKGSPEEDPDAISFKAECKIIGFYTIEGAPKLDVETITRAALIRGALQIYPMVRRHLMSLVCADGPRFKMPVEPDFAFLRMSEPAGNGTKKTKTAMGGKKKTP